MKQYVLLLLTWCCCKALCTDKNLCYRNTLNEWHKI